MQINSKINPIKKWAEGLNRSFYEGYKRPIDARTDAQHHESSGKRKSKPQ